VSGCLAPVEPRCGEPQWRNADGLSPDHLCARHHAEGWPGCGWHRETATSPFSGERFSYVVLDHPSPPMRIDPHCLIRLVGTHAPCHGQCDCCADPFVTDLTHVVEHTSWGYVASSSVCGSCGTSCVRDHDWHARRRAEDAAARAGAPRAPAFNGDTVAEPAYAF